MMLLVSPRNEGGMYHACKWMNKWYFGTTSIQGRLLIRCKREWGGAGASRSLTVGNRADARDSNRHDTTRSVNVNDTPSS